MKKVGIVTHFHGSLNYGGVLQACALCRVLEQMDMAPEQIRFTMDYIRKRSLGQTVLKLLNPVLVWNYADYKIRSTWRSKALGGRRIAFQNFNKQFVPSTKTVYNPDSIKECGENYDAFITGSDQVWNPDAYFGAYFLDFAPSGKPKLSYAASVGKSELTEPMQEIYRGDLEDFTAISVREKNAVGIIQPLTSLPVQQVLDPTLLLKKEQWDDLCAERLVEGEYLFCFFLGYNPQARKLAKEYAAKHGLKIVTIPHASSLYVSGGSTWGDVRIWDASPAEFLSLVKHAACVFTDSFHACAFSTVYEKNFFVVHRAGRPGMSGRIYSLLELLGCEGHFCDTEEKMQRSYLESLEPVDYDKPKAELENLREKSFAYLRKNLL